jgi:hypothetical protein
MDLITLQIQNFLTTKGSNPGAKPLTTVRPRGLRQSSRLKRASLATPARPPSLRAPHPSLPRERGDLQTAGRGCGWTSRHRHRHRPPAGGGRVPCLRIPVRGQMRERGPQSRAGIPRGAVRLWPEGCGKGDGVIDRPLPLRAQSPSPPTLAEGGGPGGSLVAALS